MGGYQVCSIEFPNKPISEIQPVVIKENPIRKQEKTPELLATPSIYDIQYSEKENKIKQRRNREKAYSYWVIICVWLSQRVPPNSPTGLTKKPNSPTIDTIFIQHYQLKIH